MKQAKPMRFRVSQWLDTIDDNAKTYPIVYGIQIKNGSKWQHVAENGEALIFKTAKAASDKIEKIEADWAVKEGGKG
jgi:hypothetical protein